MLRYILIRIWGISLIKLFNKTLKPDSNPRGGDEVEVLWQQRQDGRLLTIIGRVEHVDPDRPKRVRLEGYKNYREVLRTITRHSTSMISNDTQSSSEYSDSQYYWSSLLYCCEGD